MRNEAGFTTRFKKWLAFKTSKDGVPFAAAYEIKVTDSKSIPFSAVKDHQIDALLAVKHGTFMYKIPDAGWQNPFDMFVMQKQPAYVVVAFTETKPTNVWLIDIDTFLLMRDSEESKSLNEKMLERYWSDNNDNCVRYVL
jgi:penicillin-binding protein-related factor A (putative recombinase)